MDFKPFVEGVKATGFPFEHFVAEKLRQHGWQIISNQYYVDDDENKPREIDILAYKAISLGDFDLRTVVIISCKKSDSYHWVFLTRQANLKDPNSNWQPFHHYSDYKPLSYQFSRDTWESTYHQAAREKGVKEIFSVPEQEIFALQEMANGEGGKQKAGVSRGDGNMYASVLSTVKALLYEKSTRGTKKRKNPTIYQFNLVCLTDGKFIELNFNEGEISPGEIDNINHIARYIAKRQQIFARVSFFTKSNLDNLLDDLDRLHVANKEIMRKADDDFFDKILFDYKRRRILIEDFRDLLYWEIMLIPGNLGSNYYDSLKKATLRIDGESSVVYIGIPVDGGMNLDKVNDPEVLGVAKKVLSKIYRVDADCFFEEDIPF